MNVISSSYGNDSIALIRWAHEEGLPDVTVVYIDTGWASSDWVDRVEAGESLAKKYGFNVKRIVPEIQFIELMRIKKGFPNQRYQWCSGMLKGVPFLNWIEEVDPACEATVLIGKRREESKERASTPEFIESSEYHGGRRVWHPLYQHGEDERDALVDSTGIDILPHRSHECHPCVNANKADFRTMTRDDINRVAELEAEVGKTMFRPKRHKGAVGIESVVEWANNPNYTEGQGDMFSGCSSPLGCGL